MTSVLELTRISEFHYSSDLGYFFSEAEKEWVFLPFKESLGEKCLLVVLETLRSLNEKIKCG